MKYLLCRHVTASLELNSEAYVIEPEANNALDIKCKVAKEDT